MFKRDDFKQVGRGFLMGGADVIPGVSGGTVALILGIYDRLVRAISRFDLQLLGYLRKREWSAAAAYVDLRFLIALGIGIASGIIGLASTMHYLLEDQEHISIHSVDQAKGTIQLNVGAKHGGLPVGTQCTVYRRGPEPLLYKPIAELTIERYVETESTAPQTVRQAMARPLEPEAIKTIEADDVVTHPSTRRPLTLAAFFGMILASGILVARMIDRWAVHRVVTGLVGGIASYILVDLVPIAPAEGNLYLFVCGMLAICAMILPGISGAFILLILGVYSDVTGLLHSVLQRQASADTFLSIAVFVIGCVIGLIGFSKLLNRFLRRHQQSTMALLCGVMLGSLRKIWPFKADLTPGVSRFRDKLFENTLPESFDTQTLLIFAVIAVSAGAVFLLDSLTAGHEHHPAEEPAAQEPKS